MTSEDITFCCKFGCKYIECERHSKNIKQEWMLHSYAMFPECPHFKEEGNEEL